LTSYTFLHLVNLYYSETEVMKKLYVTDYFAGDNEIYEQAKDLAALKNIDIADISGQKYRYRPWQYRPTSTVHTGMESGCFMRNLTSWLAIFGLTWLSTRSTLSTNAWLQDNCSRLADSLQQTVDASKVSNPCRAIHSTAFLHQTTLTDENVLLRITSIRESFTILLACTLGNKCAKNCSKGTIQVQLIVEDVVTFFGTQRMIFKKQNIYIITCS